MSDPKDVSTYSHMFGCWETLFVDQARDRRERLSQRKRAGQGSADRDAGELRVVEEGIEHPQGRKMFVGQIHQCFGQQFISSVENGRLKVVHRTTIEDGLYEPEADYTTQPL